MYSQAEQQTGCQEKAGQELSPQLKKPSPIFHISFENKLTGGQDDFSFFQFFLTKKKKEGKVL